jgi:hypothetical protein
MAQMQKEEEENVYIRTNMFKSKTRQTKPNFFFFKWENEEKKGETEKHDWGRERGMESNKRLPASHARRGSVWMRLTFWQRQKARGAPEVYPRRCCSASLVKQFFLFSSFSFFFKGNNRIKK